MHITVARTLTSKKKTLDLYNLNNHAQLLRFLNNFFISLLLTYFKKNF